MANCYLTNTHKRKIITENLIFHNLCMSKYVQSKKKKKKKNMSLTKQVQRHQYLRY